MPTYSIAATNILENLGQISLYKGKLLKTIPTLYENWKITFDFRATGAIHWDSTWQNIFQMTTFNSICGNEIGCKMPAIWFYPNIFNSFKLAADFNFDSNYKEFRDLKTIEHGEWTSFEMGVCGERFNLQNV